MNTQAPIDARELIQQFERGYVNFHKYFKASRGGVPPSLELHSPSERPIREEDVPASLRAHLEHYRRSHPNELVTLIKYMRTLNGSLRLVIEDESGLPPQHRLLCLSQTLSLYSEETLDLVTEVYVCRRDPS